MAYGQIGTAKTSVTVREGICQNPRVIRVGPGVFAVFYYDNVHNICVKTYSSDAAGAITGISTTDTVVDAAGLTDLRVIHIAGTVYALVYYGPSNIGRLTTVDIGTDGTINDANIAALTWQANPINRPSICPVRDNVYAIVYRRTTGNQSNLTTVSISQDGATLSTLDTWGFANDQIQFSSCVKLSDGYICIAYPNWNSHLIMFSVWISAIGGITEEKITEWQTGVHGSTPNIIKVGPREYVLALSWLDNDGWVQSITIADTGDITQSWDDSLEFDPDYCGTSDIISLGGIYRGVCFKDDDNHWALATFWIEANGQIRNSNIDTYDHGQVSASYATWCWALEDIYIVAWENSTDDILITPINIESFAVPPAVRHEMMMGMGP